MKTLETVQKTFKVFKTLAKVAEILCIVSASIYAVLALCAVTWQNGGHVFSIFGQPIESFFKGDLLTVYVRMLALTFTTASTAILLGFAHNYLKHELAGGTPFTESGAERLKMLGIRCIYIPIIARVISMAIAVWQGVSGLDIADNLPSVVIGIALIIVSVVFRYGSELESKNKASEGDANGTDEGKIPENSSEKDI